MVDAHKHGDAAHHAGPLPLKFVWFTQTPVDAGVEEPDDGCGGKTRTYDSVRWKSHVTFALQSAG